MGPDRYNDFLFDCNAASLNRAFRELGVGLVDRMLATKTGFLRAFVADLERKVNSVARDGAWGPGRDDAIGLSAAILLGPDLVPEVPAPVDYPSVWNQQLRRGTLTLRGGGRRGSSSGSARLGDGTSRAAE